MLLHVTSSFPTLEQSKRGEGLVEIDPLIALSLQNKAIEVFTNTILGRVVQSKSKDPIIAACVYLACRMENYPRTLDEVSFATGVDVKLISKMQQVIARSLKLSIGRLRPQHLVNRFATRVGCVHAVTVRALEMCQRLTQHELLETVAPQVVAAGALVLAALTEGERLDVALLTSVALVSLAAVKTVYRSLFPVASLVVIGSQASPAERARLLCRLKELPVALDKLIVDGKLIVKAHPQDSKESPAPLFAPKTEQEKQEKSATPAVDTLADLLEDLTAPVTPAVRRVSTNNLQVLLDAQQLQSTHVAAPAVASVLTAAPVSPTKSVHVLTSSPKPPARRPSIAVDACEVGIKHELTIMEDVAGTKRASRSFSYEEHRNDLEMLEPDRKVRKMASAKG
mmetsp:Transcript_47362/g.82698  ORF Transcript_47362/g.82698 Transcript_47362/m.82698 type:complete len:397 (-) Transcript_47362:84-1274(-)